MEPPDWVLLLVLFFWLVPSDVEQFTVLGSWFVAR